MALPTGPSHNINLGKLSLTDEQFKRVSKLIRFAVHSVVFHKDDDLEQDVWVAVIRAANRYDPRKGVTFDNYIFARARGAVLDSLRKNKLGGRTNPDVHVVEFFEEDSPVIDDKYPVEDQSELDYCMSQMTPRQREILNLRFLCGLKQNVISEIFGITQSGVSAQIINARKKVGTR